MFNEILPLHDVDVFQGCCTGHGMVRIGMKMMENFNGLHDHIGHPPSPKRDISTGYPLCHGDHVRLYVEMVDSKPFARSSKSTDDFIDDEKDSISIADFPDDFPIFFWRGIRTKALLDGFADKGGDLLGILKFDDALNISRAGNITVRVGEMERAAITV